MASFRCASIVVVAFTIIMFYSASPAPTLAKEKPGARSGQRDSETELLEERRAVLDQLVKVQLAAYRSNKGGIDSVIRSCRQLLSAELNLESRPEERIRLISDSVETMSDCELMAKEMYRANKTTVADVLEATAARLDAQAQLLREQGR